MRERHFYPRLWPFFDGFDARVRESARERRRSPVLRTPVVVEAVEFSLHGFDRCCLIGRRERDGIPTQYGPRR